MLDFQRGKKKCPSYLLSFLSSRFPGITYTITRYVYTLWYAVTSLLKLFFLLSLKACCSHEVLSVCQTFLSLKTVISIFFFFLLKLQVGWRPESFFYYLKATDESWHTCRRWLGAVFLKQWATSAVGGESRCPWAPGEASPLFMRHNDSVIIMQSIVAIFNRWQSVN